MCDPAENLESDAEPPRKQATNAVLRTPRVSLNPASNVAAPKPVTSASVALLGAKPKSARVIDLDDAATPDAAPPPPVVAVAVAPAPAASTLPFSRDQLRAIRDRKPLPVPGFSGLVPEYHALHSAFELLDLSVCMAIQPEHRRWTTLATEVRRASLGVVEVTVAMLGTLLGTWAAECQAAPATTTAAAAIVTTVLYLVEWASYVDPPRRDFALSLPDNLSRTERALATVRRSTQMKQGLIRRQEKVQSGVLPSWDLPTVAVVDPASPAPTPGATLASLLQRPDLTAQQREHLARAAAAATATATATTPAPSGGTPARAAPPRISAHILARVQSRELEEEARRLNPAAEVSAASQEQCQKFISSMHAVILSRMDPRAPQITISRAELLEKLQRGASAGPLQLRLTEAFIDRHLAIVVKACAALGNDWFEYLPARRQYTFRRAFQIGPVMEKIRADNIS